MRLTVPEGELRLMTALTSFATAVDVTVAESVLESFLPADAESAEILAAQTGRPRNAASRSCSLGSDRTATARSAHAGKPGMHHSGHHACRHPRPCQRWQRRPPPAPCAREKCERSMQGFSREPGTTGPITITLPKAG